MKRQLMRMNECGLMNEMVEEKEATTRSREDKKVLFKGYGG
jgi:hypothetical protein